MSTLEPSTRPRAARRRWGPAVVVWACLTALPAAADDIATVVAVPAAGTVDSAPASSAPVEPAAFLAPPEPLSRGAQPVAGPRGPATVVPPAMSGGRPAHDRAAGSAALADWRLLGAMVVAFAVLASLRFLGGHRQSVLPHDVFEVLGTAPLAANHTVRVVRFGPRTLLVAVSSGGCATLAEITDAEATTRIAAACRGVSPRRSGTAAGGSRPPSRGEGPGHEPPERPGRRIAAAAIAWVLCATAAGAEPQPEAALNLPAARVATALEPIEPPRTLLPLPGAGPAAMDPPDGSADMPPRESASGLAGLLSPRTIETLIPSALLFGVVSLVPAVLLMTTCFVRISIVLMLLRQGLGTVQVPSNQILASLAIFLSALVMWPVWSQAWRDGVEPYRQGELEPAVAFERGTLPIRRWMSGQIEAAGNRDTMLLFLARHPAGPRQAATYDDVPLETLLPAFLVSELDTAFAIGFRMLLPFLVLDILVATLVVSTGLVMLPPSLVSLPLKLLVFVAADGWTLVVRGLLDGVGLPAA
jgi:flagellar biosynthetic protein FliP